MKQTRKPIVVVGSINMDLVAAHAPIPLPGQTIIGTGFSTTPGGKGANQAVAAARLGYPVKMVGAVGDDVFGQAIAREPGKRRRRHFRRAASPDLPASLPSWSPTTERTPSSSFPAQTAKSICDAIDRQVALIRSAGMVLCQLELPIATI